MNIVFSILDWFIPSRNKENSEVRKKSRLLVGIHFITIIYAAAHCILYYFIQYNIAILALSIIITFSTLNIFIYRVKGSDVFAANFLVFWGFLAFMIFIYSCGGIFSPTLPSLLPVAIVTFLFGNRFSGFLWSSISILAIFTFLGLNLFGVKFPYMMQTEWLNLHYGISFFGASAYVLIVVIIYDSIVQQSKTELKKLNTTLIEYHEELKQQNEEMITQRDEIEAQRNSLWQSKDKIEKFLYEVNQSINYAQRIQTTILPECGLLDKFFSEHFILYKPKDKVSGDFYWWAEVEEQLVLTVADCTGHGVPGAFMTMLGTSFLREIVQKEYITDAAVILRKLRKETIKALKQKGLEGEQKDGMDIALVSINKNTMNLQYAGAYNSLLIVVNPEGVEKTPDSFIEIKADKMPIAIYDRMNHFTNHEIQLNKGDMVYILSDGFVDQFGGPHDKKFLAKNFQKLIFEMRYKTMEEQYKILTNTLVNWMGSNEQTDDITVLGFKV